MPSINDFVVVRSVSSGAFGKVVLARHRTKQNDQLYAIKVMDKQHMLNKNMADRINKEKNALAITHSDFVVKIFYALESRSRIYLVMEYMVGGDLKSRLKSCIVFTQQVARFYVAECALALEYIHKHGIIHRDIKPDNILIGGNGHIKLTDFGLCNFKRDNIDIADVVATPLNPARKLPARTPGQVLSLITNFRLTCESDAAYASTPTFVTAHDGSSTRSLSSIGEEFSIAEEFSTPRGGSDDYKSCVEYMTVRGSSEGVAFGPNPNVRLFGSSGNKRLSDESFGPESFSPNPGRKRHRSETSAKRLWFTASGDGRASAAGSNFGSEVSSAFDLSLIRASTPQEGGDVSEVNVSFGLNGSTQSSEPNGSLSQPLTPNFVPGPATPLTAWHACATADRQKKQKFIPRRSVRFTSLVPAHTTIREHNDTEDTPDLNTPINPILRRTKSVTEAFSSRMGRLKKLQAAKSQSGIVGTPDYLAPEILRGEPHTSAVDVWSLGVCLYEFLIGCPPFIDETVEKVFANILARDLEYPEEDEALNSEAVETIEVLLDPDVIRRPSAVTLRSLPLFKDLDFLNIHNLEPPWIPDLGDSKGDLDHVPLGLE